MKYITLFLIIFFSLSLNAQNALYNVPTEKIVNYQIKEDSLLLVIETTDYKYIQDGFHYIQKPHKSIRKELYLIDTIGVFHGEVIPEKTIEEHYRFDYNFEFYDKPLRKDHNSIIYNGYDSLYHMKPDTLPIIKY